MPKALLSPGQVVVSLLVYTVPKSPFWSLPPLKGCEKTKYSPNLGKGYLELLKAKSIQEGHLRGQHS